MLHTEYIEDKGIANLIDDILMHLLKNHPSDPEKSILEYLQVKLIDREAQTSSKALI